MCGLTAATITEMSATALAQAIRAAEVTSVQVIEAYLDRIEAINPRINAMVVTASDALERAAEADTALAKGRALGPLHGVPFTVKDVFGTAGLVSPLDRRIRHRSAPLDDCTVVARMRAAGAILLGKSNCPPNGSGMDTENAICGRTLNPYDLSRSPGGSSGGETALVASGGTAIGLGSDLSGGLRVPAHYCGVIALKPTAGRVPNSGVYNQPGGLTDPRTQIGPVARSVEDVALLLPIIAGPDSHDATVVPVSIRPMEQVDLRELTVAFFLEEEGYPVTLPVQNAVGAAAQSLARAGALVEPRQPPELIRNSRDIDYYWKEMAGTPGRDLVELFSAWDALRSQVLRYMQRYDIILCPADHHPAPPFKNRDANRFAYTVPFSLTGYPAVVVRVGESNDLPVGVQIVAQPWREDVALAAARWLEQEFGGWRKPSMK
jgi:amidase